MSPRLQLPPMPTLKDMINMYQLKARKVLSQNYIMDMNINRKIVRHAKCYSNSYAVEIGPGPGGITRAILETNPKQLDVVEIDEQFLKPLNHLAFAVDGRLKIHHANILKTDLGKIASDANYPKTLWCDSPPNIHIIANLPFNIASPLIVQYLRDISRRQGMWAYGRASLTLTFQLEVAKRICAPIDSEHRGRLSIMAQCYTDPQLVYTIPSRCFVPEPDVDVGVVRFLPLEEPLLSTSCELLEKFIRHAFHFRQKNVIAGVRSLYPVSMAKEMAEELMRNCKVNPTRACYELSIHEICDMALYYETQCRRIPGLFAYNSYGQGHRTLEELSQTDQSFPPVVDVGEQEKNFRDGISLSDYRQFV